MEYSTEMIKLARTAKTPEELQKLAEENQIVLSEEQAREYFDKLNRTGELADEELDNVAGGCGKDYESRCVRCYTCGWNDYYPHRGESDSYWRERLKGYHDKARPDCKKCNLNLNSEKHGSLAGPWF